MKKLFTAVTVLIALAACSHTTVPPQADAMGSKLPTNAASSTAPAADTSTQSEHMQQQKTQTMKESVYFDFDKENVKPRFVDVIRANADLIKQHPGASVKLEGNADERGSNEYNLALGNRRATSVSKSLVLLGIPENHISVVSFGEERPRANCHNETCWKENRRVDFVVTQ